MQAASISYGKETAAVASDDDDDDEGGGGEGVVGQESRTEGEGLRKTMMIPDQVHATGMKVQQDETDTRASTGEHN